MYHLELDRHDISDRGRFFSGKQDAAQEPECSHVEDLVETSESKSLVHVSRYDHTSAL